MLFLTALILAAAPLAPVPAKPICRLAETTLVSGDDAAPSVHPLGNEPAARQVLAVLRTTGGCITPVVVRDMVGTNNTDARR